MPGFSLGSLNPTDMSRGAEGWGQASQCRVGGGRSAVERADNAGRSAIDNMGIDHGVPHGTRELGGKRYRQARRLAAFGIFSRNAWGRSSSPQPFP